VSKKDYVINPAMPTPICVPCWDFTPDGVQHEKRTVVIAAIVIEDLEEGVFQYSYACSRGPFCRDKECRYVKKDKKGNEIPPVVERLGTFLDR